MPSPPRQPRGSPPRQALHERSESETNKRDSQTLRLVGEPVAPVYEGSPFPTKPSQVLLPSGQHPQQQAGLRNTLDEHAPLRVTASFPQEGEPSKEGKSLSSQRGSDTGRLTERSSADVSFYTAPARGSTAFATPNLGRSQSSLAINRLGASIIRVPDDADTRQNEGIESQPARDGSAESSTRQPSSKDSDNSLSSTNSTGTVIVRKAREGKKRASYTAFPHTSRPTSSRSNVTTPISQRSNSQILEEQNVSTAQTLSMSPSSPDIPACSDRLTASALTDSDGISTRFQYPTIKSPSVSGSYAESSNVPPPRVPPRSLERAQRRWNPHLSTVQSERGSTLSGERSSQNMWLTDSSRASKSSSNILSPRMGPDVPPVQTSGENETALQSRNNSKRSSHPSPPVDVTATNLPRSRDTSASTIRVVTNQEDEKLDIPPTIPGSRDSENVISSPPEDRRPAMRARASSKASLFRDSIPAWARSYYARPVSSFSHMDHRDSISTDNISVNILRGQNRQRLSQPLDRRVSGLRMHPIGSGETNLDDFGSALQRRISPHLWHDRASLRRRRSLFKAPSIDEAAESNALTKRNAQILLFVLGFIFPLSWFVASFLPLPPAPDYESPKGKDVSRHSRSLHDVEKQLDPTNPARYENARWWRNINRMMCFFGFTVIIIIVSHVSNE